MKANLDQAILDLDGRPLKDGEKMVTLRTGVVLALSTPLEEDRNLSADETVKRWKLCMTLYAGGEQEITPEDAALIRGRLPRVWTVVPAGQAIEMLKG